jgi:hypothetical protein
MAAPSSVRVDFLQLMAQSTATTDVLQQPTVLMPLLLLPTTPASSSPNAETCPITFEPIGADSYHPPQYASSTSAPCRLLVSPKYAHLLCAELMTCKHRFDARALMAHFLHNGMTCPLCRQGDPHAQFDPSATFQGFEVSDWVLSPQPPRFPKRRRVLVSELMAAILLSDAFDGEDTLFRMRIIEQRDQQPLPQIHFRFATSWPQPPPSEEQRTAMSVIVLD